MKMEVLAVQTQYGVLGSNKVKDWSSTLTPPTTPSPVPSKLKNSASSSGGNTVATNNNNNNNTAKNNNNNNNNNNISSNNNNNSNIINNNNSINKKSSKMFTKRSLPAKQTTSFPYNTTHHTSSAVNTTNNNNNNNNNTTTNNNNSIMQNPYTTTTTKSTTNLFAYADTETAIAVNELSMRLLDELRAAKSRHLTCTEVSLPCDLTPCIAAEILRVSEKEPCGIRGCTIYIEFEDEPNNSRRIASLKLHPDTVSTFEVYLTLRQDHRGWTSLLPQFMKSLARTITISPEFTITKHKLYSPQQHSSYSYNSATNGNTNSSNAVAIAAPTS